MYTKSKDYVNLFFREKKSGISFYTRLWYPPKENTIYIKLGDKTEDFDEELAFKKIKFIKDKFLNKNYDYQYFLKNYGKEKEEIKPLTLNEVAEKYFNFILGRIKTDFLDNYKDRFNIKDEKDLLENQVFKKKVKSFRSSKQYYINHFKVKEWELRQEYTREKKPKQKLTKVGIKKLHTTPERYIKDITLDEIYEMLNSVKEKLDISQKTKHNLISMLKTIFIFAKKQRYIKDNPFDDIDKKSITKNPHNYRKRILDIWEVRELFEELHKFAWFSKKPNAFLAALLGLATGARANSILNIRKLDFKFKKNMTRSNFIDAYYSVNLINFKTQNKYELPLAERIGRYFFYLLKDYDDEEYIIRHSQKEKRLIKPFADIPKEFSIICQKTVNANSVMKELFEWIEKDELKISQLEEVSHLMNIKQKIKIHKEQIRKNLKTIKEIREKEYKTHEDYLASNFSFHNFRHQLVSLCSVINPLYAKRILNHSSDRKDAITDKYIKSELEEIKKVLEKALNPYLDFLDKNIEDLQKSLNTNRMNELAIFKFSATNEFFDKKEAERTNKNIYELYKNEEILFKIVEDLDLTDEEREEAIRKLELYGEFDEKYLEEERNHFNDDDYLEVEMEKFRN